MSLAVEVVFRPIRTGNAFEETVERLLHAIKLGVVTAGERLPAERELALRLGVSRATLRDSIRELEQAGYVESRWGRSGGTFVIYQPTRGADEVVAPRPARGSGHSSVRYWTPFGGFRRWGLGRELGPDALDDFTEVKNVFTATDRSDA